MKEGLPLGYLSDSSSLAPVQNKAWVVNSLAYVGAGIGKTGALA